jgi:hypothetical protein
MGSAIADQALLTEQDVLSTRLYTAPWATVHAQQGATGVGKCLIRMLLTWLSYWRWGGAYLHPAGVWQRWIAHRAGLIFELWPALGPQHPLLTDPQIICLFCKGSPFSRPPV